MIIDACYHIYEIEQTCTFLKKFIFANLSDAINYNHNIVLVLGIKASLRISISTYLLCIETKLYNATGSLDISWFWENLLHITCFLGFCQCQSRHVLSLAESIWNGKELIKGLVLPSKSIELILWDFFGVIKVIWNW